MVLSALARPVYIAADPNLFARFLPVPLSEFDIVSRLFAVLYSASVTISSHFLCRSAPRLSER